MQYNYDEGFVTEQKRRKMHTEYIQQMQGQNTWIYFRVVISTNLLSSKYNSTYNHYCPNNWQQKLVHPKWTCQTVSKVSIFCMGTIVI